MDLDIDHTAEEDTMTIDDDHPHSPRQDQDGDAVMDGETDALAAEEVDIAEDEELEVEYAHEDEGDHMDAEDTPPVKEHIVSPFGAVAENMGRNVDPFSQLDHRPSFHAMQHVDSPVDAQAGPSTASAPAQPAKQNEGDNIDTIHPEVSAEQPAGHIQDQAEGDEEHYEEYEEEHHHIEGEEDEHGEEDQEEAEGDEGFYEDYEEHEAGEDYIGDQPGGPEESEVDEGAHPGDDREDHKPVAAETSSRTDQEAGSPKEAQNEGGQPETQAERAKDPPVESSISEPTPAVTIPAVSSPPLVASPSANPSSVTPAAPEIDETEEHEEEHEEEFTLEIAEVDEDDMEDYPTDIHSMPAVILHLPKLGARSLFLPLPDGSKLPVWLSGRLEQLGESSLSDIWSAIKEEMAKEKLIESGEMIITERQMELKMGEVSFL